jgi:hypothetical protein
MNMGNLGDLDAGRTILNRILMVEDSKMSNRLIGFRVGSHIELL